MCCALRAHIANVNVAMAGWSPFPYRSYSTAAGKRKRNPILSPQSKLKSGCVLHLSPHPRSLHM